MDEREEENPPRKPLLPFLEGLNQKLPSKWDRHLQKFGPNDDWLLWKLEGGTDEGAHLAQAYDAYSQSKTR
jgi:hypothetical protein